jgi:hypothetical protein
MDSRIMSAAVFNRHIKTFEKQTARISNKDLKNIGSIFVRHRVEDYGAGMLHRHYDLRENHIMAHTPLKGRDLCKAYPLCDLDSSRISPHALCLNEEF